MAELTNQSFTKMFYDYLASSALGLVAGSTLHAWRFPQNAPALATVILNRSPGPKTMTNDRLFNMQLLTRAATPGQAEQEAERIFDWITNTENSVGIQLDGWYIYSIEGNTAPGAIGADSAGREQWSANVIVRVQKES
jgi:hypothetical protein